VFSRYNISLEYRIIEILLTKNLIKTMASTIDPESAKSLIKEYQQQNGSAGGPGLLTPDKQLLNGFFIERESLEKLLSNSKVAGISLHFAKHPDFAGAPGHHFTMFYAGAEHNTESNPKTPYVNTGEIYKDPPPCPTFCTKLA
jgi:hypothetical protein